MYRILIKNGRVWDGKSFSYADVLTEDNTIARIEPNIMEKAFKFDAKGMIVAPGLVDAHMHIRRTGKETFGIQPEMACFPFGVTAAADAGVWHGTPESFDVFMVKNVVFVATICKNNHAILDKMEEGVVRLGRKVAGIKVFFDTTTTDITNETVLAEVCEFAHKKGLPVMVHCSHSPIPMAQLLAHLQAGDILTHAFHGAEHNAAEDNFECMRAAQKRGVFIDCGFAGNVHTDFGVFRQAIESGIIPDIISTDITKYSAYIRGGRYGMTMCMSMAKAVGMDEEDIFRAVTATPAKALGMQDQWGTLKVGGPADISVLAYTDEGFDLTDKAGNRLCSDTGYRCILTIADGQIIYKH